MEAKDYLLQLDQDWYEMYIRSNVLNWRLGVLQPEYVYFEQPLVIIDDAVHLQPSARSKKRRNKKTIVYS